jgi:hypothetical protein
VTAVNGQQAVKNARQHNQYAVGMCQKFVRGEAWHGAKYKHPGDRNPPVGAPCFYSGGQYGHIVIWTDAKQMRSTDCPTSGRVSEEDLDWPVRTWGDTYLGWTEDLNGVRLPIGQGEDDEMKPEDWDKLRGIVHEEVEQAWAAHMTVTAPGTGEDTSKKRQQVLREVWQKVTKAT